MNYRYTFKNWFPADDAWKQSFQIKEFFPDSEKWNVSSFFPYVTFFTVFGDRKAVSRSRSKKKIFWTGEDVTINHTKYADNCVSDVDLSIGFTPEDSVNSPNYIRYPLWLLYYLGNHKTIEDIQTEVDSFNQHWLECVQKKTKFCSLVASHDRFGTRKQLYDILNQYKPVSCAGRIFHNDDSLISDFHDDKCAYLEQFMFNLCPENVSAEGYTTEKVFQSFASGCIPVYYGSKGIVEPEVVDNSKIIFYDGSNGDEVLSKIRELTENPEVYREFVAIPPLKSSAAQWIFERNQALQQKLADIIR